MPITVIRNLAFAALLALVLAACGGGETPSAGAPPVTGGGGAPLAGGGGTPPPAGTTGSASLSWTASAEPDLNGYRVYYGTDSGIYIQGNAQGINVGNRTSFVVDGLNRGRRYFFAITAYDTRGNESAFSREQFKDIP